MKNKVVTITGPSCAGKTTFAREMVSVYKNMEIVPTYTTRPLRDDDSNYIQVTEEEFKKAEEAGEFIETNYFCSHLYGTKIDSLKKIWRDEKVAVKVMEPNGIRQLQNMQKAFDFAIVRVWLGLNREELNKRLENTGRNRNIENELAWYKELNWNIAVKNFSNSAKLMETINRLLPTLAKHNKMRVWQ